VLRRALSITIALTALELLLLGVVFTERAVSARQLPRRPDAPNIASHRPYTLAPSPNYPLTSDAGDATQLTDGVYSGRTMWTRSTSVGWANTSPVTIVIDLGRVRAIGGVSFNTAAGAAGVEWPRSIFVLVSDDASHFFAAGDLAALSRTDGRPATGYATFPFETHDLRTHGRYVAFVVDPTGPFTFCDEIEVYEGDPAWVDAERNGEPVTDLPRFFLDARTRASIDLRVTIDVRAARAALDQSSLGAAERARLSDELDLAERESRAIAGPHDASFRATLPLNAAHARILGVHGAIAEGEGRPALSAWAANPWDHLRPLDRPQPAGRVSIAAMPGETRAGAINLRNSTGRPMTVSLAVDLAGAAAISARLRLYEVVWTDTREAIPVADALVPLVNGTATIRVPAGLTKQVWMSATPGDGPAGLFAGQVTATADSGGRAVVPIDLQVLAGRLPARWRLHLGGWDYTDADRIYGLTPNNRASLMQQLQRLRVDAPWATSAVMPFPAGARRANAAGPHDTSSFDRWVSLWPDARRYLIFINGGDAIGDVPITSNGFHAAVARWLRFWTAHAVSRGLQPSQLMLLLVDEPRSAADDQRVALWAEAIRAANTGVQIWEDPNFADPARTAPKTAELSDVLALDRTLMDQHGSAFTAFYRRRQSQGQVLDVYAASGPVRLLDPYSYNRLQAWICADLNASGSFFWSFIDGAGSWNEYGSTAVSRSPFFLSADNVTMAKHSEAILEGMEDVEYLFMLRDRVAEVATHDSNNRGLTNARRVLASAVARVLQAPGAGDKNWTSRKDRSAADRVRLEIHDALIRLHN